MQEAARIGMWAKSGAPLPYLRRVAYLESHGTEYIDTKILPDTNLSCVCDVSVSQYVTGLYQNVMGVRESTGQVSRDQFSFTVSAEYPSDDANWVGFGAFQTKWNPRRLVIGRRYVLSYDRFGLTLDGIKVASYERTLSQQGRYIYLFGRNTFGFVNGLHGRIFSCSFRNETNGELVVNFIPVLDLSGIPAMYDDVSGQLFYNQGTGEFTFGELDAASDVVSSRGGGTECLTPRRSYRRSLRPSARFCAHSHRWEVAA